MKYVLKFKCPHPSLKVNGNSTWLVLGLNLSLLQWVPAHKFLSIRTVMCMSLKMFDFVLQKYWTFWTLCLLCFLHSVPAPKTETTPVLHFNCRVIYLHFSRKSFLGCQCWQMAETHKKEIFNKMLGSMYLNFCFWNCSIILLKFYIWTFAVFCVYVFCCEGGMECFRLCTEVQAVFGTWYLLWLWLAQAWYRPREIKHKFVTSHYFNPVKLQQIIHGTLKVGRGTLWINW